MVMTSSSLKGEVLAGPEQRRRWSAAEKVAMVAETHEAGVTVSLVARRHGVAPNQLFTWRRLVAQGALTAARAPRGACRAGFGLSCASGAGAGAAAPARQEDHGGGDPQGGPGNLRSKKAELARALVRRRRWPMKTVCEALGASRSNLAAGFGAPPAKPKARRGRPPADDTELVAAIRDILADQPTYGYWRVWGMLRRRAEIERTAPVNRKRVYRIMKVHGLLLRRHAGGVGERRHDGRVAVERSNLRWCSDGFELACDNGEKVRVAFALDCHDREALAHVATTEEIKGEDVRDLMVASVETRFGQINRLPEHHRMADRQRLGLYCQRHAILCARDRSGAADHARSRARSPTAWPKPLFEPSSAITPA